MSVFRTHARPMARRIRGAVESVATAGAWGQEGAIAEQLPCERGRSMDDGVHTTAANHAARFELAPPRRFVLPAILLLLSEQPGYGYSLEKDLQEFRFGRIDRPTVYRALAQLEADGLVESW